MSTRAMYTFHDAGSATHHVYKHHDGYPSGAVEWIRAALDHAWPLPRFEADDFAAAFVAANKWSRRDEFQALVKLEDLGRRAVFAGETPEPIEIANANRELDRAREYRVQGGGVRLMPSGSVYAVAPSDIEYRYEITLGAKSTLWIKAYSTNFWDVRSKKSEKRIFQGTLEAMEAWAKEDA